MPFYRTFSEYILLMDSVGEVEQRPQAYTVAAIATLKRTQECEKKFYCFRECKGEALRLFRDRMCIWRKQQFYGYKPRVSYVENKRLQDDSVVWLAHPGTWDEDGVRCMAGKNKRGTMVRSFTLISTRCCWDWQWTSVLNACVWLLTIEL